MSKAAIQQSANALPVPAAPPRSPRSVARRGPIVKMLMALASLRLTVVLFALSIVLVFFGTMAQMDEGILSVLHLYFRTGIAWIPYQALVRFGQVFFGVSYTFKMTGSFPYPGGWLLGALLLVNLLAAHAVRFRFAWKRSGILLIHSGLVILMLSELITGLFAVEALMQIPNEESRNYVEDIHNFELAIVDATAPRVENVTVVPASLLRKGGVLRDEALPFDVEVVRYLPNSGLVKEMPAGTSNPATRGIGVRLGAVEKPLVSGVDGDNIDIPSVYVTLKKKGTDETLGTYLLSAHLDEGQTVRVDGKKVDLSLRFQRTYKPYTIQLLEFHHDIYPGTDIPRNFSSLVRLTDPSRKEDRTAKISMNNPLNYASETFYQNRFLPNDSGTILQVVHNPGWTMPYISCFLVVVGMLIHFGLNLVNFVSRRMA